MKIGQKVKPLRRLKHSGVWSDNFGYGKTYTIIDFDSLDSEEVLVLKTGNEQWEYMMVYPDEVEEVS